MPGGRSLILRTLLAALAAVLVILQLRLWASDDGFLAVRELREQVRLQKDENEQLAERNQRLEAEVLDLKKGFTALEERARSDLGLIAPNETFYVFGDSRDLDQERGR